MSSGDYLRKKGIHTNEALGICGGHIWTGLLKWRMDIFSDIFSDTLHQLKHLT